VQARNQLPVAWDGEAHQRLRAVAGDGVVSRLA